MNINKALMLIDIQNEYFNGKLPVYEANKSLDNILKIIEAAKKNNTKIIVVQHTSNINNASTFVKGTKEWELHNEIKKISYDKHIEKNYPGSFTNTDLEKFVNDNNINHFIITGYMTQMCCDTTARQAFHMNKTVDFISDATGTIAVTNAAGTITAADLHKATLITQAMRFSNVINTNQLLEIL